jgi:hypothetical protein
MQRFEICDFVCKKVCKRWLCARGGPSFYRGRSICRSSIAIAGVRFIDSCGYPACSLQTTTTASSMSYQLRDKAVSTLVSPLAASSRLPPTADDEFGSRSFRTRGGFVQRPYQMRRLLRGPTEGVSP